MKKAKKKFDKDVKTTLKLRIIISVLVLTLKLSKREIDIVPINATIDKISFNGKYFIRILALFSFERETSVVKRTSNPKSAIDKKIRDNVCAVVKLPNASNPYNRAITTKKRKLVNKRVRDVESEKNKLRLIRSNISRR